MWWTMINSAPKGKHRRHWVYSKTVSQAYLKLNSALFGGRLPELPCYYNHRLKRAMGRCLYYRDKRSHVPYAIDLGPAARGDSLYETLLHEMVHVWQGVNGFKPCHDQTFRRVLRTKTQDFQDKCQAGTLDAQPFLILPSHAFVPLNPSGTFNKLPVFPKKNWVLNSAYTSCLNELNTKKFGGHLPLIGIYENKRLSRSLCRLHLGSPEEHFMILAVDVKPKVRVSRLKPILFKLLTQFLSELMRRPPEQIHPAYRLAHQHNT
jgi:hypothetical protein